MSGKVGRYKHFRLCPFHIVTAINLLCQLEHFAGSVQFAVENCGISSQGLENVNLNRKGINPILKKEEPPAVPMTARWF